MNPNLPYLFVLRTASVLMLCLLLTAPQESTAQDLEPNVGAQGGRFGVGFASSWPAYGVSGTLQISETLTAEAVLGFLGTVSNLGGRVWYRFNQNPTYDLYGYGGASLYRYRYNLGVLGRETESVLGLGAGVGIEAGLQKLFNEDFPPIFLNWEIGLALASFEYYNFSSFVYGGGIHYRFGGR